MDGPFCEDFLGGSSAYALPRASGSTAGASGSTAGLLAVVPLQPAVVPLAGGSTAPSQR